MAIREKELVRRTLLGKRLSLSDTAYETGSRLISDRILALPEYTKAKTVLAFSPIVNRREPDINRVLEHIAEHKKLVLPVTDFATNRLRLFLVDDPESLQKNKWGIAEPDPLVCEEVGSDFPDLILVPMAGGDLQKNRVGYGKGFYDRILSEATGKSCGIVFECCLTERVPTEKHDIPLDLLVTEKREIR